MKLKLKEGSLDVQPLSAGAMEKFYDRLEENRKFSEEHKDEIWQVLRRSATLAADMICEAVGNTAGLTPDQIKALVPHWEANDWMIYLIHGPAALEKKRASESPIPTPTLSSPQSAP